MPLRPCLDCGTLTPTTRCPPHTAAKQQAKDARRPTRRTWAEISRRRTAVAEHVAVHGWWCPGLDDHAPHPSNDLTAEHIDEVALGHPESGPLTVLCRSENSRRGAQLSRR